MSIEMLYYVLIEIAMILCFVMFWQHTRKSNLKQLEANQRADDDIVVMHKLMIEADEETYLHTANVFRLITSDTSHIWLDRGTYTSVCHWVAR